MSETPATFTGNEASTLIQQAYKEGVRDSTLRATQIEPVLTDLLAELRDAGRDQATVESVIDLTELADTYEQRLREVQGE